MHDWADEKTAQFIIKQNPDFIYLDGPLTYLQDHDEQDQGLSACIQRIKKIIESTRIQRMIVDHHLLRDLYWKKRIDPLFRFAEKRGIQMQTAAEYRGEENNMLEARRAELYENEPP